MIDSVFRHEFKQRHGVQLTENHILFRKPLELYNLKTDETFKFNSLDDAYKFEIDGKTIKQIITDATMEMFKMTLDMPKGNSPQASFKFELDGGSGNSKSDADLPARMNTKIKVKTEAEAIKAFRATHVKDRYESAIEIDSDGFVSQYVHGEAHSVGINPKGGLIVHNHPSSSNFSGADLLSAATTKATGVVASGRGGDYIFKKGTHFKANDFVKGLQNANLKGENYNDAVHKWLKKNQKRYGFKYTYNPSESVLRERKQIANIKRQKTLEMRKIKFDSNGQGSFF